MSDIMNSKNTSKRTFVHTSRTFTKAGTLGELMPVGKGDFHHWQINGKRLSAADANKRVKAGTVATRYWCDAKDGRKCSAKNPCPQKL